MSIKNLIGVAALAAVVTPTMAQPSIRPLLGMSVTGGGEKLVTVRYTNGSTQDVRSGGLVHVFAGMEIQPSDALAVQLNVGWHADDSNARNASVKFTRIPGEALLLWKAAENIRLGAGVRKAFSARLSSSGDASATIGNQDVESQVGAILQGEYLFGGGTYGVLLRYVNESYRFAGGAKVSGNHGGLGLSVRF